MTLLWAGRYFQSVGSVHGPDASRVPHREVRELGRSVIPIRLEHRVQRLIVVSDQLGPAVYAIVEVIEKNDPLHRIKAAEGRLSQKELVRGSAHSHIPPLHIADDINTGY